MKQPAASHEPSVIAMEAEAVRDVAQIARLHAERLPASSPWQGLFSELAASLSADESRLRLAGSAGSAREEGAAA